MWNNDVPFQGHGKLHHSIDTTTRKDNFRRTGHAQLSVFYNMLHELQTLLWSTKT